MSPTPATTQELQRLKEEQAKASREFDWTARKVLRRLTMALEALREEGKDNGPGIEDEFEHSLPEKEEK